MSVVWIYDNIQRNYIAWNQTVSNKNTMRTGTAATILIMDGVSKGDLDPKALAGRLHLRSKLTFDDLINDLDQTHLDNIGKANLISICHEIRFLGLISCFHDLIFSYWTYYSDPFSHGLPFLSSFAY